MEDGGWENIPSVPGGHAGWRLVCCLTGADDDSVDRQPRLYSWLSARPGRWCECEVRGSVPPPWLPEQDSNIEIDLLVDS